MSMSENTVDAIEREIRKLRREGTPISTSRAAPSAWEPSTIDTAGVSLPPGLKEAIAERTSGRDSEDTFYSKFWNVLTGKKYRVG
jgi:hypothetical protein